MRERPQLQGIQKSRGKRKTVKGQEKCQSDLKGDRWGVQKEVGLKDPTQQPSGSRVKTLLYRFLRLRNLLNEETLNSPHLFTT